MNRLLCPTIALLAAFLLSMVQQTAHSVDPVRVGIVGIDSYQCVAFTQLWHKPPEDNVDIGGLKVVAAWKGGSPDIEKTMTDVERWVPRLKGLGVTIEESIDDFLRQCDAVIIMTVDGRAHLKLAELGSV